MNPDFVGYPEHAAVFNDDLSALTAALSSPDADVAAQHHAKGTPLALAIALRRSAIVSYLVSKFTVAQLVDISRYSDFDAALSVSAAQHCDEPTFALLLKAGVIELTPDERHNDSTLCHFAAMNADARVLARLIACGVPFDDPNGAEERPSHCAASNTSSVAALQTLIDAGCDLQACDRQGDSLAHHAAHNSNEAAITALIAAGATLNALKGMAIAPIHVAAENSNDAVIRALIAAGVDLNVVDVYDNCPCYLACRNANHKVLQQLLAAGATLRPARSDGVSPCHEAARNHNLDVMKLLIERGVDVNARNQDEVAPLHEAAHLGSAAMVALLHEAGAAVDVVDSSQETVCHCAARNTDPGVMRALIAAGADFRSCSINENMTPLAIAISCDNVSAIKALIEAGVDLAAEIAAAPPELLRQAASCPFGRSIGILIRYGADYRLLTSDGLTACHWSSSGALVSLFALGFDLNMPAANDNLP
jgi:ankyrin repeat protein